MKKKIKPELAISVTALVLSIIATASSIYFAYVGLKTNVLPQLVFVWDISTGWSLNNVGNGTAMSVVVAHQPHFVKDEKEWKNPTFIYHIPSGQSEAICWVGQNPDKLIAVYSDSHNRMYTSFTDEDRTTINEGEELRTWKESDVRRIWERFCP